MSTREEDKGKGSVVVGWGGTGRVEEEGNTLINTTSLTETAPTPRSAQDVPLAPHPPGAVWTAGA